MSFAAYELKPVTPTVVQAEQVTVADDKLNLTLSDGTVVAVDVTPLVGEWAVRYPDGTVKVFTDAEFQATFQPFAG